MTGIQSPDALKDLVQFMIGLAILGLLLALAGYFAVDLPAQNAVTAPTNEIIDHCVCIDYRYDCLSGCIQYTGKYLEYSECIGRCYFEYDMCVKAQCS